MSKNKAKKNLPPRLARALTLLRIGFNWSQEAVAEANGRNLRAISDLEQGRTRLERHELDALVRALGATAADVEAALEFLDRIERRPGSVELPEPSRSEVVAFGDQVGVTLGTAVRSVFEQVYLKATALGERRLAQLVWPRLRREAPRRRHFQVMRSTEFRGWAMVELACAESRREAANDPHEALELAELALAIAELEPGEPGWSWRLQGLALAHVANARRVLNQPAEARQVLDEAKKLWQDGAAADPGLLDEAQLPSLEISLLTVERKYEEALRLVDRAQETARGELVVDLWIKKANLLELLGEYRAALAALRAVEPRLAATPEARKIWLHRYTLINILCHLGQAQEAARFLPELRELTGALGNALDRARLAGPEGRVAAGLEKWAEAARFFEEAFQAFAAAGLSYDRALVALELAAVYLELGRTREVQALAAGLVPVFEQQGVPEEAGKALALFVRAVEQETATAELARQIVAYLYRARGKSNLPFVRPE